MKLKETEGYSTMNAQPDLMTTDEVAAFLRVPHQTVYRLHSSGRLPGMKVTAKHLRWHRSDVVGYLDRLSRTTASY